MPRATHPPRRRYAPRGLLGMLALVGAVELFLLDRDDHYTPDLPASWRHAAAASTREATRADVLCFGDSMVKFGVLPTVLDEALGKRSYNLALHAGPPSAAYFLLHRVIEAGANPRVLVVDFGPHQLARDPRHDEFARCWPELASAGECLDLALSTSDAGFLGRLTLGRALPSYRLRHEVRAEVVAALDGQGWSARGAVRALRRNWEANQGAQVLAKRPEFQGEVNPLNDGLFPAAWESDPVTLGYVRRFLRLAEEHRIAVYWLLPPLAPAAQERREALGLDAPFDQLAHALQAEFPDVTLVDARRAGYDASVFVDAVHLDRDGASTLTADLADVIRSDQRGSIALPAYQPRSIAAPVEDLEQSTLALQRGRRSSRLR